MWRAFGVWLAVLNLGVAAWWWLHQAPVRAELPMTEVSIPALKLVAEEVGRQTSTGGAELQAAAQPLSDFPVCLRIGPFASPAEVRMGMDRLMPHVGEIQYREAQATSLDGYRVFLPATPTYQAALENARVLESRGIQEYYIVTSGPQRNTVSLGLFKDLQNAEKRRDEIVALGFNVQLETRTDAAPEWWIEARVARGFDAASVFPADAPQRFDRTDCP